MGWQAFLTIDVKESAEGKCKDNFAENGVFGQFFFASFF